MRESVDRPLKTDYHNDQMTEERRQFPRVRCYVPVRLYPQGEMRVIETLTKDLGMGGLRVLSPFLTPVATPISVELIIGVAEEPLSLRAQTVWFETISQSDQFYLGLAFQHPSPETSTRLSRYIERISVHPTPAKV